MRWKSRGSAKGQSSVELLAAFGVYLMIAALILESAQQLELPARTAFERERSRLSLLSFSANLALADELDISSELNRPYNFNLTRISTGGMMSGVNGPFLEGVDCNTTVVFSGGEGVNVTCVDR